MTGSRTRFRFRMGAGLALLAGGLLQRGLCSAAPENLAMHGLTPLRIVALDREATGYATFQSHNQKVVSNRRGIFASYIRSRNEPYTAQQWRLVRSTDGGQSFTTLYEATHATNPPVLETDAEDNVYLVRPDFLDGHAYLYRFAAADGYREPLISRIEGGGAGKFAMHLDPDRRQLYYFPHNYGFHVVGLDGRVRRSCALLRPGTHADMQYPLLSLAPDGVLHAAWTTVKHGVYLYWDIHHMLSRDGGQTWERLDGTPLALPVVVDDTGPTDRVSRDDEFEVHTWLSSFLAKAGKLHFLYQAQSDPPRQHYVRYDVRTGRRDVDIWPELKGETISVQGLDGFFASRAFVPDSPLYCVHQQSGRIACLASDDNGETWYDYALSEEAYQTYGIGGCRELTSDGYIIGTFTDQHPAGTSPPGTCPVYFLKIQAGISRAEVLGFEHTRGVATVRFARARGQPVAVSFRGDTGRWGRWLPFRSEVKVRTQARPTHFRLRSRLGVVSEAYPLTEPGG